ncbi:hypothetical protein ACFQYP_21655 [Nonomuraea antimicrobica]
MNGNAKAYAEQANNFAIETQYSKISINVAFWVTVIAIFIALVAAFFSAAVSVALVGPYAAGARAALSRILVRLAAAAARRVGATRLARVAVLSGPTGRSLITRLLATPLGLELIEEIGEEFFITVMTQYQQIKMGTIKGWDWKKIQAAILGAATGAMIGMVVAGPISRIVSRLGVRGFAGRALTVGLTNMIASPAGSFVANGVVYQQWQNPFTPDALLGGFMGGVGRTGTISPFNPSVAMALGSPLSTLADAYNAAAQRAGHGPGSGGPGEPGTPNGGPTGPQGGPPGMPGTVQGPEPATPSSPSTSGVPAAAGAPAPAGRPGPTVANPDMSAQRRASAGSDQNAVAPAPGEAPARASAAATPQGNATARQDGRTAPNATPGQNAAPTQNGATQNGTQNTATPHDGETAGRGATAGAPASGGATTPDGPTSQNDGTAQGRGTTSDPATANQQDGSAAVDGAHAAQDGTPATVGAAPGGVTNLGEADGTRQAGALIGAPAPVRARAALVDALNAEFPGAVLGPTGDLLVPGPGATVSSPTPP